MECCGKGLLLEELLGGVALNALQIFGLDLVCSFFAQIWLKCWAGAKRSKPKQKQSKSHTLRFSVRFPLGRSLGINIVCCGQQKIQFSLQQAL